MIKQLTKFVQDNDEDFLYETIETLEHLTMTDVLKDNEIDIQHNYIISVFLLDITLTEWLSSTPSCPWPLPNTPHCCQRN